VTAVILILAALGALVGTYVAFVVVRALVRAFGRYLLTRGGKRAALRIPEDPAITRTRELYERWMREDPEGVRREAEAAQRAGRITEARPGSNPQFLGSVTGDSAPVDRFGSKASGLVTVAAGPRGAIEVHLVHDKGKDYYTVILTPYDHGGKEYLLARGVLDANVPPVWRTNAEPPGVEPELQDSPASTSGAPSQ